MVVASAPARARFLVFLAACALALALPAPASADHVQTDSNGMSVAFDHRGGNEWWVEVVVGSSRGVTQVDVMDDGGAWAPMTYHHDWGAVWARSYHVEPGHRVMFRTLTTGGDLRTSCWFTHPAGVEQCTTTPPPGAFDATFTGVRGNEWWVQAQVATNGPAVAKVEARFFTTTWLDWQPVAKQSWGWGSSYYIPQGTIVQLRATASDGQTDLSSCRQWVPPPNTDASIVACPGSGGGSSPFDATFTGVKGNEWWVQANVAGNQPIVGVAFRVNCDPMWRPLVKQSWGGWAPAGQVHFKEGDKVDFIATSSSGAVDASGGYIWRSATPTTACALGAWPHEGSRVVYDLSSGVCGGGHCELADATLTLTYRDHNWVGMCTGEATHNFPDGSQTREPFTSRNDGALLWAKVPTGVGAQHGFREVGVFYSAKSCGTTGVDATFVVDHQERHQTAMVDANHDPRFVQAWVALRDVPEENRKATIFDTTLGMVVEQRSDPRMSSQGFSTLFVTDTDAPLRWA